MLQILEIIAHIFELGHMVESIICNWEDWRWLIPVGLLCGGIALLGGGGKNYRKHALSMTMAGAGWLSSNVIRQKIGNRSSKPTKLP